MDNVFTIPSTIGPPNAKRASESITVPHGQGVIIDMCARGYDGHPLPNPEDHDFYLAVSRSADGAPLEEWHIGDPQVSLVDPAMSKTRFRLRFADLAPYLQEGVSFRFDGWSQRIQPELEDPVRHVQGTITLGPSILGQRQPFFNLTPVGFNDLLGPVSDQVYLVDLRTGFKGGKLPIEYSATAGGIVNNTLVLSREAVVNRTVTVTAIDGRNDEETADFRQITYAPLAFVALGDVIETREANGTIDISLSVGFSGGYGNRAYEADQGTINGSVLTLSLDQLFDGAINVTATDEDDNVASGSFQFTVEAAVDYPDDPGMVTTNGANLTTGAIAGTNPAAMVHGVWITAPDVMAAETTLWLNTVDNAGTTERAYVTIYDTGERLVSIYTRDSGGVLQPSVSEYITNDPIQPGDRVFLALSVSAGGTLHSYQIRNGGNFTSGAGVAVPAGHTMPIYGAPHRFYDSDNVITEGSFLWALPSLPSAFADLAAMNAAKSSFVTADGTRATLNDIYGVLGEPVVAIYGTAEDYNAGANRGTIGGTFTISGTFGQTIADGTTMAPVTLSVDDPDYVISYDGLFDPTYDELSAHMYPHGSIDDPVARTLTIRPSVCGAIDNTVVAFEARNNPTDKIWYFQSLNLTITRPDVVIQTSKTVAEVGEAVHIKVEGLTRAQLDEAIVVHEFLGDDGEWQFIPTTAPLEYRRRNTDIGYLTVHAWNTPGTHQVRTTIYMMSEPVREITTDFTINDPEVTFAGKTYWYADDGDNALAPAGATILTSMVEARNTLASNGGRLILKPGVEVSWMTNGLNADREFYANSGVITPILITTLPGQRAGWRLNGLTINVGDSDYISSPVIFDRIDFVDGYDTMTGDGLRSTAIQMKESMSLTLNGCTFWGVREAVTSLLVKNMLGYLGVVDCDVRNWENYGLYLTDVDWAGLRGCRVTQKEDTINGIEAKELDNVHDDTGLYTPNYPDHSSGRSSNLRRLSISQFWGFSANGWSNGGFTQDGFTQDGLGESKKNQGIWRFGSNYASGAEVSISYLWGEGGGFNINGGGNARTFGRMAAFIADNVYLVGSANNAANVALGHTGVTFRNPIFNVPDVLQEFYGEVSVLGASTPGRGVIPGWEDSINKIVNPTVLFMLSPANHGNPDQMTNYSSFFTTTWAVPTENVTSIFTSSPAIEVHNPLVYAPHLAGTFGWPAIPDGIVLPAEGTSYGFEPLYKGKRQERPDGTVELKTIHATPKDIPRLALLGAASTERGTSDPGLQPIRDYFGQSRDGTAVPGATILDAVPSGAAPVQEAGLLQFYGHGTDPVDTNGSYIDGPLTRAQALTSMILATSAIMPITATDETLFCFGNTWYIRRRSTGSVQVYVPYATEGNVNFFLPTNPAAGDLIRLMVTQNGSAVRVAYKVNDAPAVLGVDAAKVEISDGDPAVLIGNRTTGGSQQFTGQLEGVAYWENTPLENMPDMTAPDTAIGSIFTASGPDYAGAQALYGTMKVGVLGPASRVPTGAAVDHEGVESLSAGGYQITDVA